MSNLFDNPSLKEDFNPHAPLANRMRPRNFNEFFGQESLVKKGSPLREMLKNKKLPSMILWGPPGTGKTTLASILAKETEQVFVRLSAVTSTVSTVREVVAQARNDRGLRNIGTILFIDEIHRFNKAQQDALLPHVEKGTVTLIGATTENPSFEVINPLLSRCQVFVLELLLKEDIDKIIEKALSDKERGFGNKVKLSNDTREFLIDLADGDARKALNLLEMASLAAREKNGIRKIDRKLLEQTAQKRMLRYDKDREWHFNIISALHKSIRGSDPDASLYWLARMLESGEEPLYIARRLIRAASEDIGNADPNALTVAVSAYNTCHYLGMPECNLALAQTVVYLATAPKSNAIYTAYMKAAKTAKKSGDLPVPLHIRNAPTRLMKDLGYGKDYKYPHAVDEHFIDEEYLPKQIEGTKFYKPGKFGYEREIQKRLSYWNKLKKKLREEKNQKD